MKDKKYILTDETKEYKGHILHRIKAVKYFGNTEKDELGGWIESESNLSQEGDCWVGGDAMVFGDAWVYRNACVGGNAKVYGNAEVYDNAEVYGNAMVYGDANIFGEAEICGDAKVKSIEDYAVYKNSWSSNRYFTWTRSNGKWKVGCFYGTGEELIAKAYKDSEKNGKCYEIIVKAQEALLNVK